LNLSFPSALLLDILPAEVLTATFLFSLPLRRRRAFPPRAVLAAGLLLALPYALVLPLGELSAALQGSADGMLAYTLLYSALSYLLGAIFAFACCAVSVREALYCATCAYLTQHFTYCLHRFLRPGADSAVMSTYDAWYLLIYVAVYALAYFFIARRLAEEKRYNIKLSHSLGAMVSALSIALVLSAVAQHLTERGGPLYPICLLYAMFCSFYVLWGQVGQHRRLALQHELDVQQQLWLKHKGQYELTAENVELINRKCHDLKHQIAALRQISDQSQREATIQALEESVMIYDSIVETGNHILDTILTEKSLLCEARGITLTCVADGQCLSFMDAVDLYTIFGNALDNAVECVSVLADVERRTIAVSVFSRADLLFIQLENYCEGSLVFGDGLPVTTKERDGNHGFGLKSIRYTAEKYGGFLTLQAEDDIFLLRVTIPRYRDG